MDKSFGEKYGKDYRNTIFEYDQRLEYNVTGGSVMSLDKRFTIVTVDNGWGLSEFIRITSKIGNVRRIVMRKGVIENIPIPDVEFVPYDESLDYLINEADVAFFPRVGVANKEDYLKLLKSGVPIVVRESSSHGAIQHEKNGWIFRDESWAQHWLSFLIGNPNERKRIRTQAKQISEEPVKSVGVNPTQFFLGASIIGKVSVITPTYKRDVKVVNRCIGSMLLQTHKDWEQIVCSDGEFEPHIESLVKSFNDPRIVYAHTTGKKDGDFGNTVRSKMLACATGEFVLFFDDDNVIMPDYIEKMKRMRLPFARLCTSVL
jgi:hypothetical protein